MKAFRWIRILALGGAALVATLASQASARPGVALDAVLDDSRLIRGERLVRGFQGPAGRARVIVHLAADDAVSRFERWNDAAASRDHRARVAILQDDVLTAALLAGERGAIIARHRFDNLPAFSADVTLAGLASLLDSGLVRSVEAVEALELHTRQGLSLVRGDTIRASFGGDGQGIAVCDSGVDYTHPQLGGAAFPNTKVIGGWDFGAGDADPFDENGHGTSVAAIAAGDITGGDDYVGGTAPGARIYALKVTLEDSLIAGTDELTAAWDWCATHRNDDPANPICVINTSLGGGRGTLCDELYPSLATAAANAVAAGMSVVVSSGNDGYCDTLAVPACLSSVISVGAVYDDVNGPVVTCIDPFGCTGRASGACPTSYLCDDLTTIADLMACYSNTSEELTLLAPGEYATAPALGGGFEDFGGTSAAAPYVAGAIAALNEAAEVILPEPLTQGDLAQLLRVTGTLVIDPESRVEVPRLDIEKAILTLGPAVTCQGVDDLYVLRVNGDTGLGAGHEVPVSASGPIVLHMGTPFDELGGEVNFVVHMNAGVPSPDTAAILPRRLGPVCFDFLLQRGAAPVAVFNNLGKPNAIGASVYFGESTQDPGTAPIDFLTLEAGDTANLPVGSRWTIQGALFNPYSSANLPVSVSNAVILSVTD